MTPLHAFVIAFGGTGGVALIWLLLCQLMSFAGGWYAVYFGVDSDGLHIRVMSLYRVGHPPLLIPWSEIDIGPEVRYMFFFRGRTLLLGRQARIPLRLFGLDADEVLSAGYQGTSHG